MKLSFFGLIPIKGCIDSLPVDSNQLESTGTTCWCGSSKHHAKANWDEASFGTIFLTIIDKMVPSKTFYICFGDYSWNDI